MNFKGLNISTDELAIRLKNLHGFAAKSGQLEAIEHLLRGVDVILSAKTGYEKSMILYSSSALIPESITLLIMPLNALEVDQMAAIQKMNADVKPCVVNGETITQELLNQLKLGMFTHILTSPEMVLNNDAFRKIMQTSSFRDRLVLIAIDEVHVVEDWGSWRPEYCRLGELRSILPRAVPFFATSATLEDDLTKKLVENLRLNANVRVLKQSIDREDLFFNVRSIQTGSARTFEDLRFLVSNVLNSLKKVIIYEESISLLIKIKETLIRFYREARENPNRAQK